MQSIFCSLQIGEYWPHPHLQIFTCATYTTDVHTRNPEGEKVKTIKLKPEKLWKIFDFYFLHTFPQHSVVIIIHTSAVRWWHNSIMHTLILLPLPNFASLALQARALLNTAHFLFLWQPHQRMKFSLHTPSLLHFGSSGRCRSLACHYVRQ